MRMLFALLCSAIPAQAWEFSANPVCTIAGDMPELAVRVTYDPGEAEPFRISLTGTALAWPETDSFAIRFDGPAALSIGTDRHRRSPDGRTLSVSDTGFGNVLDGLALNDTATAIAGDRRIPFDLAGARPAVEAFRACAVVPSS